MRARRWILRSPAPGAARCRRKFLRLFPGGFRDETYRAWERDYKWDTHERWNASLGPVEFRRLLDEERYTEIAARAVRVEQGSRHPMLFSFETMALRDAVKTPRGARAFAQALHELLHSDAALPARFERWVEAVDALPRRQTRVLTWPIVTVFGFVAQPATHLFVKPKTTRAAAREYGFELDYASRPSWATYASVLDFAALIRSDLRDLRPRDMIDLQSFMWVQGSDEYRG